MKGDPRRTHNAITLAFVGDAVWELAVRCNLMMPPRAKGVLQKMVQDNVKAESQSALLARLEDEGFLNDGERDVVRWGRNGNYGVPKRFARQEIKAKVYKDASAFEVLVGWLYLSNPERLQELLVESKMLDTAPIKAA